jgi:hypothetical protein
MRIEQFASAWCGELDAGPYKTLDRSGLQPAQAHPSRLLRFVDSLLRPAKVRVKLERIEPNKT